MPVAFQNERHKKVVQLFFRDAPFGIYQAEIKKEKKIEEALNCIGYAKTRK